MNRNEFLKNIGLGTAAIMAVPSLLSSCMDHGMEGEAPNVSDGIFNNPLKIPQTINATSNLSVQLGKDILSNAGEVAVLGYGNGILGPTIKVQDRKSVV